ncbi:MAG: glycoside hydrolase family 88 protein [Bacteroides cellulosilyticus]
MKKIYTYLIFSFALLCSTSLIAQTNEKARETAVMIADRILKSTTYDFVDKKSGKTYTSLKNVPLNKNVKVQSKYLDWHYTNGVTNIAPMELGDKLGTSKYENYVLKNMNFIFDDANQDYFHRLYNQILEQEGWRAVNHVNWHMIYRNKRLDDNGPMGASLIVLNRRHPEQAFQKYIDQTDHHLMVSEPRLADGTIARLWPHVNTIWADDAFMALSFLVRMGEATGDAKYFDDAANQILNYTRYLLWCPEKGLYYHCYHTDNKAHRCCPLVWGKRMERHGYCRFAGTNARRPSDA